MPSSETLAVLWVALLDLHVGIAIPDGLFCVALLGTYNELLRAVTRLTLLDATRTVDRRWCAFTSHLLCFHHKVHQALNTLGAPLEQATQDQSLDPSLSSCNGLNP
mgnify:FL=1